MHDRWAVMTGGARSWSLELARDQITVNCVAPVPIATKAFRITNLPEADHTRAKIGANP